MAIKPLLSQQQRVTYGDEEETKLPEPVVPGVTEDQPQTQPVSDSTDVQVTPIMPGDTSAMGPAAPVAAAPVAAAAPEPMVPETAPSVTNVDATMPVETAPATVAKDKNIVKSIIDMIGSAVLGTGEQKPLDQVITSAKETNPDAYATLNRSSSQQLASADASFSRNPPKTEQAIQAASVVKGFKIAAQHRELGDEGLRQQIESDGNPLDRVAGDAYLTALALGRPPWRAAEDAMKAHQTAIAKTAEIQAKVYEDRQVIEQQAKMRAKAVATNTAATERAIYKKAASGFYKQQGGDGGQASVPAAKIAQGLDIIKVGIETGDFESARTQLSDNGLDFLKRDLDSAEQRYNENELTIRSGSLSGAKGVPSTLGVQIASEGPNVGKSYVVTSDPRTGQNIATPVGGGRPLTQQEAAMAKLTLPQLYAEGKAAVAGGVAEATETGKGLAQWKENVEDMGSKSGDIIRSNEEAIRIMDSYPNLTEVLAKSPNPETRAILAQLKEGIKLGNFGNLSVDFSAAINASKSEAERSALARLQQIFSNKTFEAVQKAGFKGAQSDKELDQIKKSVISADSPEGAIRAFLIKDIADQRVAKLRASELDGYLRSNPGPLSKSKYNSYIDGLAAPIYKKAREDVEVVLGMRDPVTGEETGRRGTGGAIKKLEEPAAPAAPAAPGAAPARGPTRTINGKTYRREGNRWVAQ